MCGLALAERGLALALGARWIQTTASIGTPSRAHAEESREVRFGQPLAGVATPKFTAPSPPGAQARLERRRRRRQQARHLKGFTEGGPQYFWAAEPDGTADEAPPSEEGAMWSHLLRHSRSAGAKARVRRAWRQWEEQEAGGGGAGFQRAEAASGPWWHADQEASWTFHSRGTAEEAARRQREQAGGAHPRFREHQEWRWWEHQAPPPPPPRMGRDVAASLAALGLPAAPPALPALADLKAAFRRSAMQHHPDRHAADPTAAAAAEKRFKEVQAAFQLLLAMVAPS